ncbi:MAG: Hsp20/alpha crystallin family protein [Ginsengibacter sp.]
MNLIKRNGSPVNQWPLLFDDFFNREFSNWGLENFSDTNTTVPRVNVKENKDNFVVEVAAPGMDKKDFKVQLEGNLLTVSSERTEQNNEDNQDEKYSRREFSYQSFQRTFTLPKDVVDADKIQAKYENGLLHLEIPKKEEAKVKTPKQIQIQ